MLFETSVSSTSARSTAEALRAGRIEAASMARNSSVFGRTEGLPSGRSMGERRGNAITVALCLPAAAPGARLSGVRLRHGHVEAVQCDGDETVEADEIDQL